MQSGLLPMLLSLPSLHMMRVAARWMWRLRQVVHSALVDPRLVALLPVARGPGKTGRHPCLLQVRHKLWNSTRATPPPLNRAFRGRG